MADKAALVDQIKAIQRGDPEAKQQWWDYCEQQLGGVKDPNRHDAGVLEDFLNSIGVAPDRASRPPQKRHSEGGKGGGYGGYKGDKGGYDSGSKGQSYGYSQPPAYDGWGGYGGGGGGGGGGGNHYGGPQQQEWGGGGGGGGGAGGGDAGLADMIKTGQRRSQHWKSAWQAYCIKCGNGFNDPTRYDEHFLLDFLDYVGQLVVQDLGPAQPNHPPPAPVHHYSNEPPIGAGKRPVGGGSQPPAKRQAVGGPEPRRGGYKPAEFDKAELVNRVKDLQRSSPDAKSAWWTFCEEHTQGIKDPNRHDAPVLLKFLQGWD